MTIRGPFAVVILIVLFLSLAANFLILGFAAARIGDLRQGAIERIIAVGARGFPKEIRAAIIAKAAAERDPLRAAFADLRAARQRMFAAMRAEPFDAAALSAAFADVRAKTSALQALGQDILGEAVAAAPADARAEIKLGRGWR
jgi:hypothetical protein